MTPPEGGSRTGGSQAEQNEVAQGQRLDAQAAPPATDRRTVILGAVADLIRQGGSARFTVGEVADRAGVSRATVYRDFAGGKDEILADYVTREIELFAAVVCRAGEAEPTFEAAVAAMIVAGREELGRNDIFQTVAVGDPETLAAVLLPLVHILRARFEASISARLAAEMPDRPVERRRADAAYVGSFLVNLLGPSGRWDLEDPADLVRLVRTLVIAGIDTPQSSFPNEYGA